MSFFKKKNDTDAPNPVRERLGQSLDATHDRLERAVAEMRRRLEEKQRGHAPRAVAAGAQ